eukprot:TRINITY_DN23550_c0_g1_i1.p1 TRINITY_DN23550_c0_g1~~TRINITY_DN23550_c0_g1_i1.p1  ORF type:complete len:230 (-),score=26.19 TRINITY_DN23550_c0_g1_i1:51-740(-)
MHLPVTFLLGMSVFIGEVVSSPTKIKDVRSGTVKVDLYYESYCPGCRHFVETQLVPAFSLLTDTGIVEFRLFPYGNAKEEKGPDGRWKFKCQHGEKECTGNILEACIIRHLDMNPTKYIPVVACMEGADDPVLAAKGCITDLSQLDYKVVKKCANGLEGNLLEHAMGLATEQLEPKHTYVPWIVVNDVHNNDIQEAAMKDLIGLVCSLYKGEKPAQCMFYDLMRGTIFQ